MRIGHYAPNIWGGGGIATYVRRTGKAQLQNEHAVFFLSRGTAPSDAFGKTMEVTSDEALFKQARQLSLDVLHLHRAVQHLPEDRVPTVRTMHGHQGSCPSASRFLHRQQKPCNRAYSKLGCLWGHLVDQCSSRHPRNIWASYKSIRTEMNLASRVPTYTVSQFLADQMARSGCPMENVHTILSPAPETEFTFEAPPREERPHFLFAGRLVPEKGLQWLLRALPHVSVSVQIDVAGNGYKKEDMKALAQKLGVSDQVNFHGWVLEKRVQQLMKGARAVVFPSMWHEPAGLVTLEAAAYGRPVIASKVGGIPEYASEEFAFFASPGDEEQLAKHIMALAQDRSQAASMGQAGYQTVRTHFTMPEFLQQLEGFYDKAIKRWESARVAV